MALWRSLRGGGLSWAAFLQDLVSVILGVLIALGVDEWRDDRRKDAEARAAMTEIRRELAANQAIITRRHPVHTRLDSLMSRLLDTHLADERIGRKEVLSNWFAIAKSGFGTAHGSDLAWELAIQSRAVEHFDAPTRLLLARVYDENERLAQVENETLRSLFATPATEQGNIFGNVLAAKGGLGDVVAGERRLAELYPAALARIDSLLAR